MTSSDPIAATATTTMLASSGTTSTANDKSSSGSTAAAACLDASCASLNPEDLHSLQDEQRDNNTNQPSDRHHKSCGDATRTRQQQWRGVLTPWDQQMRSVAASRKGGGGRAGGGRKIQIKTDSGAHHHQPLKDPFAAKTATAAALDDKESTTTSSPNAPKTAVHDSSSTSLLSASCASLTPDDLHSLKDEQHDDDGNRNNNKNEESEASIVLGDDESSGDLKEDEKETPEAPQWQGVLTPWDQQMRSVAASRKGGRKKQSALKDRLSAFENQTGSSNTKMHSSLSHLTSSSSTTAGSSKVAPYHHHSKPSKQKQQHQHPSSLQASCPNFNLVEDEATSSADSDLVQGDNNHQRGPHPVAVLQNKGTTTSSGSVKDRMRLFEKKQHPPAANGRNFFNASYSKLNNRKTIKQDAPCLQASCPDFNVRMVSTHLPKDSNNNSSGGNNDSNEQRAHANDSDHYSHNSSCSSLQLSEVLAAHGEAPIASEEKQQKQKQQEAEQGMRGGIKTTSSSSRLSAPKPLRNRLAVFEKPGGKPVRPKCLHESISYLSSYHTTTANASDDDSVASFQSSSSSFAAADALIAKVDEEEQDEEEVNFQIPSILEIKKATPAAATTAVTEAADAPTLTSTEVAAAAPSMTTTDHVAEGPRQQQQEVAPPLQSRSFHGTSVANGGKKKKQWHVLTPWQEQERAMLRTRARREGKRTTSKKGAAVGSLRNRLQAFENNSANKERSLNDSWDGNLSISSLPVNLHR